MKKNYPVFVAMLLALSSSINGQVNYSFSATTATYVPVTGGTTPPLINRIYDYGHKSYTYDEGVANGIPIGFIFNYNGIDYDSINICANGFATLGSAFISDTNTVENFYINNLRLGPLQYISGPNTCDTLAEPGNIKPVLAPFWDDLNMQVDSNLRYITTGSAGSRIFTLEWSHAHWQYDAASATLSFQLKLYEGTNVIEFCYKDEGGSPSAGASASIGITASSDIGGFMSLENTTSSPTVGINIETDSIYKKPADNQVYRFTPLPCKLPLNVHFNSYNNTSVNFSWQAPSGITNFEYAVTTSPDTPATGTSTTSTSQTVSSLFPGTKYFIHVRSFCSASSQSAWSAIPFITTKNTSPAPSISWQKSIGGNDFETVSSINQTTDGGYILGGYSTSNNGDVSGNYGWADCWIVKLSSAGTIAWQKNFGGTDYDDVASIIQTSDSGYIFIGYTQSNNGDVVGTHGGGDIWLVKLSDTGTIQWQKPLGGSNVEIGLSVEQTSDGGYIISGATDSNDGDVSGNHDPLGIEPDIWIAKLDSTGNIQWQKCLGGTQDEYGRVKQTSDGGYIIVGTNNSSDGDVTNYHGGIDMWVIKLNGNGVLEWQKSLGGSNYDGANSCEQTSDGGYIIAGSTSSRDGDVNGDHSSGDLWLIKLNTSGDILWQKFYGGSCSDDASSIKATTDGGYIVAGNSNSKDGDVNGNHGKSDYWIVKINSSGEFQWQKCMGGSNDDRISYAEETTDRGYIMGGSSTSNDGDVSGNKGTYDIWVVKLAPDALLPVTLLTLTGEIQGKQNLLHWTTVSEQNNAGFEIQRSNNGNTFSKIGFVNTKAMNGNSTGKLDYDFTDAGYSSATNYYRLKQIDKDGKFNYSNIVVLRDDNALDPGLSIIYPNPVNNVLNVKIASSINNKLTLLITDLNGKPLLNKITSTGNGENIVQLDVSRLPAGTYFLKLICTNGCENAVTKFVKQ